jgi:26S proteasome regulatory subunit N6
MPSNDALLKEAESVALTDSKRAEEIYKQILSSSGMSEAMHSVSREPKFRSLDLQ